MAKALCNPSSASNMSQKITLNSVLLLGFAGFFSALLAICAPPMPEVIRYLLPGTLFGVSLSLCLWSLKILRSFWKTLIILAVSSIVLFCSALAGAGIEYFSPWSSVHDPGKGFSELSATALFVSGTLGAFLFLSTVLLLVRSGIRWTRVLSRALCWSPVGGVLGIVGWSLGPSLGAVLWSLKHSLGLTGSNDRFAYAIAQGGAGIDSLMVVWQTGVGLVIALALAGQQSPTLDE
jgi:hypothetical protein